jgi:Raf kinase inhibitor-like YbhB/YbcL family protein
MAKKRLGRFIIAAVGAAFVIVQAASGSAAEKKAFFDLMSPGHKEFGSLAKTNGGNNPNLPGCNGDNVSPALQWTGAPAATKSYAIELFDLGGNPPAGFVHWIAYDIPASKTSLKEGEASEASSEFKGGKNGAGSTLYFGPCPPPGAKPHPYTFMVMATDIAPGTLQAGMTRDELAAALKGHIVDRTMLVLRYGQ